MKELSKSVQSGDAYYL